MAQGGLIFALVFGLIAVASAALAGSPGTCAASCTGWCDLSNNCCTLPSNCARANCANSTACTKTVCTGCGVGYTLDATTKGCCSITGTGLTGLCTAATCDANGANVKCTACAAGYSISAAGICVVCTQPRCTLVATCDAAGAGTSCTTCTAPAVRATDGKCCTAITNCATISTCAAADGSAPVCTACAAGYILSAGACVACPINANCLTGQANLRCTTTAGPSTCVACPAPTLVPVVDNSILTSNGECCKDDLAKNCGTFVAASGSTPAVFGIKSCGPTAVVGGGFTYGPVLCASCKASTVATIASDLAGASFFLDATAGTCTACTPSTEGAFEFDTMCATWGCTTTAEATNFCLSCPATGNTVLSVDKKCGPPIANCDSITVVDAKLTGTGATRTIATFSRCGTAALPKCKPGFYFVAGVAVDQAVPTSDVCTACTVPATATNCASGSCTGAASAGFVCLTCSAGFYLNAGACVAHSACVAGSTYLTAAGTSATNTVCTACSSCGTGKYVAKTCTVTTDTVCDDCKVPCDNCAASTCLGGCNTCTNNYVFTATATVCELACGNGRLNTNEQCDETVSGECVGCQCNAGFYPNSAGVCTDVDECAVYTCALNSGEAVECTADEPNTRTCTCLNEKTIRSSTDSAVTLESSEYFNGCNDADLSEEDFLSALTDDSTPLDWFLMLLGASGSAYEIDSEDSRMMTFSVTFDEAGSALTTAELAEALRVWFRDLWGIAFEDVTITVVATDGVYGVAVELSETATDSAATFAPLLSVVAALLMLIR